MNCYQIAWSWATSKKKNILLPPSITNMLTSYFFSIVNHHTGMMKPRSVVIVDSGMVDGELLDGKGSQIVNGWIERWSHSLYHLHAYPSAKNDFDFGMQNATNCLNYVSTTDRYCGMIGFSGYVKDSPSSQIAGAHTTLCHP